MPLDEELVSRPAALVANTVAYTQVPSLTLNAADPDAVVPVTTVGDASQEAVLVPKHSEYEDKAVCGSANANQCAAAVVLDNVLASTPV